MKGKTAILGIIVILIIVTGTAWGGMAIPISPGGGTEITDQSCPTFSWSASEGALSYRIEVYQQVTGDFIEPDSVSGMGNPVIAREIPAPALSWTPSSGECLTRGMKYVWYVRGVDAEGEGQWSGGLSFQVEASVLSLEQQDAVKEVVKEYVKGESAKDSSSSGDAASSTASEAIGGTVRTSAAITPMALPPVIQAYGDASNTILGVNAGVSITSGINDTFIGADAGNKNTEGSNNSFLGRSAGNKNTTGNSNSFLGRFAGFSNTEGSGNSFLGRSAGYLNTTGIRNVFIGYSAGYIETGSHKLYIDNCYSGGNCTQPLIYGEFDNRIVRIDGRLEMVTVATPSDIRYKKEIYPLESPLQKVLQLQGVTYEWDKDKVKGAGFTGDRQIGLIAQEVEKVLPELVHTDSKGYKTLSYDKLGPVLVEALKEQQKEIKEQEAKIESQSKEIMAKDAEIQSLRKAMMDILSRVAVLESSGKTIASQ